MAQSRIDLENLPHVWRAPELARSQEKVVATGHSGLDAQLPGGGWPVGSLIEILQDTPGRHAWQLLLGALAAATQQEAGPVVLVNAPYLPFGPSLDAQGLSPSRLLKVQAAKPQACVWAAEQALRCCDVVAVAAWLPRAKAAELRRLHLAAAQHDKLLFAFRETDMRNESSPARVRLEIEEGEELTVRILKRRGPPLEQGLPLPSHPQRLARLLDSRKRRGSALSPATNKERSHVLDRIVAVA
jgi:protein ImuA